MALQSFPMQVVIEASEVQNNFRDFLQRVKDGEEHVVFEEAGNEVAVLVNMPFYEEFRRWYAKKLIRDMGEDLSADFERRGVDEEQLIGMLEDTRKSVNQKHYGQKA